MINIVMLLGRAGGLDCAKAILDNKKRFQIKFIATHRYLPKNEGGLERPEFEEYFRLAYGHQIPKIAVDSKDKEEELNRLLAKIDYDVLISCNWRRLVSAKVLKYAKCSNINIHRGKLPEYAGAEPVLRAIKNGDKEIIITAHEMSEKLDDEEIIYYEYHHPVNRRKGERLDRATNRVKNEIGSKYHIPMMEALDAVLY